MIYLSLVNWITRFINNTMKVCEIITEASEKKITKRQQYATKGLNVFRDGEKANSDYAFYRIGMAAACTDGKNPPNMKAKSWVGKSKTAHPYTKEEQDMLKLAYKAAGASYKDLNKGDMTSKELESTNTVSPVAKPKRNRFGV